MNRAGWQRAKKLVVPDNVTVLYLPPHSPVHNPVERLWAYMQSHHLSNRNYDGYDHLLDASAQACRQRTPQLLRSVCARTYVEREIGR